MTEISSMLPLGTIAPNFKLPDTISGNIVTLNQVKGDKATVIMFICNHCPYVIHIASELPKLANDYMDKAVRFVAINANDATYFPEDSPENMSKIAERYDYPFPYLYDESQSIAKAYRAICTPDFYLFDSQLACVYRGRMDDATPGNHKAVTGCDLRLAIDGLIANLPISPEQKPSIGCSIKWRSLSGE